MNPDQLAFLNRQLASLLKDGVPLEGALRQAASDLTGPLRQELTALEADLARGEPLGTAVGRRKLPTLYVRLLQAGAASGDVPGALAAAADHYEEAGHLRRRVQSAVFYPLLILVVGMGACGLALRINRWSVQALQELGVDPPSSAGVWMALTLALLGGLLAVLVAFAIPPVRRHLECLVPGFRDARIAQVAGTFELLLASGCPLPDAVRLVGSLERGSGAAGDLEQWDRKIAAGTTRLADVARTGRFLPPYFRWLVLSAGDNIAQGFGRAARFYRERARHRIELLVNSIMPVSIIGIGLVLMMNFAPLFAGMISLIDHLGSE